MDIEQLENKFQYLLSDNPACAGRFICDDYKPKPHDDSNITRCKNEANKIKLKLQAIKDKISKHDDCLFSENTGKLKPGLSCHHSFNNEKRYYVTFGIEKDVDRLIDLLSPWVLTTLAQNPKLLKPERERSREKNQRTGD